MNTKFMKENVIEERKLKKEIHFYTKPFTTLPGISEPLRCRSTNFELKISIFNRLYILIFLSLSKNKQSNDHEKSERFTRLCSLKLYHVFRSSETSREMQ